MSIQSQSKQMFGMFSDFDNCLPEERKMVVDSVEEWKISLEDMACAGMPSDTPISVACELLSEWLNLTMCQEVCETVMTIQEKREAVNTGRKLRQADAVRKQKGKSVQDNLPVVIQIIEDDAVIQALVGTDMKVRKLRGGLDA